MKLETIEYRVNNMPRDDKEMKRAHLSELR